MSEYKLRGFNLRRCLMALLITALVTPMLVLPTRAASHLAAGTSAGRDELRVEVRGNNSARNNTSQSFFTQ